MSTLQNVFIFVVGCIEGRAAQLNAGTASMYIDRHGRVTGFLEYIAHAAQHKTVTKVLVEDPRPYTSDNISVIKF